LNGRDIPFVKSVKYLGVIFDKRTTWKLHIETTEAKAFITFIGVYSIFKSGRLSPNIKLTLHKAVIRSVMTYACAAREFATETHLLKLQSLQYKILRTIGNFPRSASVRDMHVALQIPYVYDYITKSCRQQAEVIQIMKMKMFATLDKAKPNTENIRGFNLTAVMCTTVQESRLP
jgi:hypothetical protein